MDIYVGNMQTTDTILVSVDFSHGRDVSVLVVGRKRMNQSVEVINAFQGVEAEELYLKLCGDQAVISIT